jgi:hypothetical protein
MTCVGRGSAGGGSGGERGRRAGGHASGATRGGSETPGATRERLRTPLTRRVRGTMTDLTDSHRHVQLGPAVGRLVRARLRTAEQDRSQNIFAARLRAPRAASDGRSALSSPARGTHGVCRELRRVLGGCRGTDDGERGARRGPGSWDTPVRRRAESRGIGTPGIPQQRGHEVEATIRQ